MHVHSKSPCLARLKKQRLIDCSLRGHQSSRPCMYALRQLASQFATKHSHYRHFETLINNQLLSHFNRRCIILHKGFTHYATLCQIVVKLIAKYLTLPTSIQLNTANITHLLLSTCVREEIQSESTPRCRE